MAKSKPAPAPVTEKGVIYARYSSSGQRGESIEGQLRDCRAFAEHFGVNIVGEYCDRAMTGTSDKRPEFQRMIRDSARGQFSVVICWKNDRFARSRYDSAVYKYKLKQNGVRLLYAKENIPDGPEGIVLESVMEGFAEYYSANLSQNVKRGNYDSALKRQTLGQRVFGLRTGPDKRWEIDPATAPVVRRIFEEYAAGKPALEIYTALNAEGFRTVRGNPFNKNSIRRILQNEKYVGVYQFADIRDENGIPPIVDRPLFDKVQQMVAYHHRAPAAKKTDGGFLLTSKLFCGECGEPMTGDSGTSHTGRVYSYYTCNGHRVRKCPKSRAPKNWIEDAVVETLVHAVQDDAVIQSFADKFMQWQAARRDSALLDGLEARLQKNKTAIKNTLDVIDSGLVTESLKSHLVELEAERADLEAGIAREKMETQEIERDAVVWFLERFRDIDRSDVGWRIFLVETFLQAAWLYDDRRLILQLNFGGENSRITSQLAEQAVTEGEPLGSFFTPHGVPNRRKGLRPFPTGTCGQSPGKTCGYFRDFVLLFCWRRSPSVPHAAQNIRIFSQGTCPCENYLIWSYAHMEIYAKTRATARIFQRATRQRCSCRRGKCALLCPFQDLLDMRRDVRYTVHAV